jgi:hypothetical protein
VKNAGKISSPKSGNLNVNNPKNLVGGRFRTNAADPDADADAADDSEKAQGQKQKEGKYLLHFKSECEDANDIKRE